MTPAGKTLIAQRKSRRLYILAEREALTEHRGFQLIDWPKQGWDV